MTDAKHTEFLSMALRSAEARALQAEKRAQAFEDRDLAAVLRLAKEMGVSRLDLHSDGSPARIEFAAPARFESSGPQVVFLEQPDPPKDEPTAVESAALRLAGRGKKAEAK